MKFLLTLSMTTLLAFSFGCNRGGDEAATDTGTGAGTELEQDRYPVDAAGDETMDGAVDDTDMGTGMGVEDTDAGTGAGMDDVDTTDQMGTDEMGTDEMDTEVDPSTNP